MAYEILRAVVGTHRVAGAAADVQGGHPQIQRPVHCRAVRYVMQSVGGAILTRAISAFCA